jgi:hypothetical protein
VNLWVLPLNHREAQNLSRFSPLENNDSRGIPSSRAAARRHAIKLITSRAGRYVGQATHR